MIGGIILAAAFVFASQITRGDDTNAVNSSTNFVIPDLLTTGTVSGEKLGSMGKPYVFVYKSQEVKLCCPDCKADFNKDP